MLLRELFEAPETVGIIFGRFNPPHQGHKAAWQEAAKNTHWYVGTNQSTIGPKDPLPFEIKIQAMETVWPEIKGHIIPEQTWWSLAAAVYKKHGKTNLRIITDETDAKVFVSGLQKQNGVEGKHGFYDFASIEWQPAPRVSSATALRAAVANNDPDAFAQAAGIPADTEVAGKPFFELVKYYLGQQQTESLGEKVFKKSLSGDTKTFRGTANRLPTANTVSPSDITKVATKTDMPDGSYEMDFDSVDKEKLKKVVAKLIPTLGNKKNEMVLRARFGLAPFEKEYTLKQIADAMGVTPEVIRQRESKALRQLKHLSRSRELRPFLDSRVEAVEPDEPGYQHDLLTMPANTLVIDTPGELDWYKIGQHYPTLGQQDPHEFGQSESDMLMTFANAEEMEQFIRIANMIGLKIKNIGGSPEHPEIHSDVRQ
jgi:hypothetical protein